MADSETPEEKISRLEAENKMLRSEWARLNREMENDERVKLARKGHLEAVQASNRYQAKLKSFATTP